MASVNKKCVHGFSYLFSLTTMGAVEDLTFL